MKISLKPKQGSTPTSTTLSLGQDRAHFPLAHLGVALWGFSYCEWVLFGLVWFRLILFLTLGGPVLQDSARFTM